MSLWAWKGAKDIKKQITTEAKTLWVHEKYSITFDLLPNIFKIALLFVCLLSSSCLSNPRIIFVDFLILTDIQMYKYTMIKNGRRKKIRDDNSRRGELVSNIPQKAELRISTSKKGSLKYNECTDTSRSVWIVLPIQMYRQETRI